MKKTTRRNSRVQIQLKFFFEQLKLMMMTFRAPAKIVIGISLDAEESHELLSWAIRVLAQPNDTVIALHVLVTDASWKAVEQKNQGSRKWQSISKCKKQVRQAKAFVISIVGEFLKICHSKQVALEARVGFSSSIRRGLIQETKSIQPEFLVIGSNRGQSSRASAKIAKYCCQRVPRGCSLVLVDKCERFQQDFRSNSIRIKEFHQSSPWWSRKKSSTENSVSSVSKPKGEMPSPRTVLDGCEGKSQSTEEVSSIFGDSSITKSPASSSESERTGESRKPMSPLTRIWSCLHSPFLSFRRKRSVERIRAEKQQPSLKCFCYEEIANATNNFHPDNLVGQGGYSDVYRGDLDDGSTIAIKCLAKDHTDANKEKEFLMELGVIGHVSHPNTAKLLGWCIEKGLYLIFHFYPSGTLSSALHGRMCKSLEWAVRYRIALGIARGLHYLHNCCNHRTIHRDIKASNVLLGADYEPHISDFGLAKWLPNKWTHHAVTPIEGTFGYLAPEYFMHGIVDEKTDVFAFGILLLEIVTGRRPVDSSKQNLLLWAKPLMECGKLAELADPKLDGKYDMDQLHRLVLTASYCVRQTSIWRPSMKEVLELLIRGHNSQVARNWRIPKFTSDEMDDYSMIFGYELQSDISFEDL